MKVGDRIVRFGGANVGNHRGLRMVGEVVGGNEGVSRLLLLLIVNWGMWLMRGVAGDIGYCFEGWAAAEIEVDAEERLGWERVVGVSSCSGLDFEGSEGWGVVCLR